MIKFIIVSVLIIKVECLTNKIYENIVVNENTEATYPNYINSNEESARIFINNYRSLNPVVLLVENSKQSRNSALNFMKNVYKMSPKAEAVNFMMMTFNDSGSSQILETTNNNKKRFEEILSNSNQSSYILNSQAPKSSAVFFAILNAVHLLPPESGIIVFMKRDIEDETLVLHALTEVNRKRIQIFVIWGGKNEEHLLKELALRSRGAFLIESIRSLSEQYYEEFLENHHTFGSASTILIRKNLKGENNLFFPIDSTVTSIQIDICPNVTVGILTTPRGHKIDIFHDEDVAQYSSGSFITGEVGVIHEIHLNTTTATTRDVGIWHLRVGNARTSYNITIYVYTKLKSYATISDRQTTGILNTTEFGKKIVNLMIYNDVTSINNISFVNKEGKLILEHVKYNVDKTGANYLTENINDSSTNGKTELNITVDQHLNVPFYAVINGKDSKGHDFTRLSYVGQNTPKVSFSIPSLTIEVGQGSELITQPFRQPQIFFEVTNNGNTPTLTRFYCRDEKGILLSMNPWYKWINPQETETVRLALRTTSGFYQDLITFTAQGSETVNKKVIVDVGSRREDRRDPELDYQFTSDCTNLLLTACEDGTWSVEVKAKDTDSGLLQVTSTPKGLYFPNSFTTGTTEEVTGLFTESCCNPDLKLIAVDRQNNRRTRNINAYRANLSAGAIAAIVLGVVLLIVIIIVIVLVCRKRGPCFKSKESYDLPTYRGPLSSRRT